MSWPKRRRRAFRHGAGPVQLSRAAAARRKAELSLGAMKATILPPPSRCASYPAPPTVLPTVPSTVASSPPWLHAHSGAPPLR